jgi:integrase/recombinase XerD
MATQTLSSTAEILLEQIMESISACEVDKQVLTTILSQYDIKPTLLLSGHPDLQQKIKLFLSGKRLEGLSPLTLKGYTNELRIFSGHIQKAADEITTADIRIYMSECSHLKTASLSKRLSVLKSMFGWLVNEDILVRDPTKRIKPPKKEQRMPKALAIEELEMIREACITPRERAMIEVLYCTGGRLSEIQAMNREDIDWQSLSVLVIGKGNKERPVYFSFKAAYHLKKYLKLRTDRDPALFVSERKPYRRLSDRGIQREIKVIAARSGVAKNVHPHIFRHTFATLMLNNGADIVAVQGLLGHSDVGTTQIYATMNDEKRKQSHHQYLVQ